MRILVGSVDSPSAEPTIADASKANKARFTKLPILVFYCRVKSKRGRMSRMNPWKTASMSLVVSASLGVADDFKTIDGKIYKDATISHVEADGIVIKTKTGISKIYFVELPKDVQERFHYGSATPTGKAVTQRIDGESFADRFAGFVEKKLDERESILQGKHTPG